MTEDENLSQLEKAKLSDLLPGEEALILLVKAKGPIRRRLLEMGFVRGAHLKVEKLAPLGDPMELIIKGYHLSIRREEGECILVERCESALPSQHPHRHAQSRRFALAGRLRGWVKRILTSRSDRRP
ncbi:MAG: hypothetical protein H6Q00_708 [Holophagaceae bacterium]|nr:hypothetical protein [Holophagaceae bacterium]